MKRMKRITSIVMALVMMVAMTCTAFAAEPKALDENHKLTVTSGQTEAAGKTVKAYQIFKLTDQDTYVLNDTYKSYFVTNDIIKEADTDAAASEKVYLYINGLSTTSTPKTIQEFADDFENWAKDKNITASANIVLEENASKDGAVATLTMPYGYYLISGNQTPATLINFKDGVATVKLKSVYPTVEKTVDEGEKGTTAAIGDTVDFTLTSKVPDTSDYKNYTFQFVDTLSKGLSFKTDSVTVKVGDATLIQGTDYTVATASNAEKTDVTIELSKSIKNQEKDKVITVTYSAVINADVEIVGAANTNSVKVVYSNNPKNTSTGESKPSDVKVYSFKVDIDKISGKTNENLKDAKFVLYRTNGDKKEYYYLDETSDPKKAAWTEHNEITKPEDIAAGEKITVVTTGEDGKAVFAGLAEGTYYLQEIEAPTGYNKLTTPTEVTINATIAEDGSLTTWKINQNSEKDSTVEVVNNTGATLPETGAMGTVIFSVLGVVLVIGGTLLVSRRKRENG